MNDNLISAVFDNHSEAEAAARARAARTAFATPHHRRAHRRGRRPRWFPPAQAPAPPAAAADGTVSAYVEPIALYHTRDLYEAGDGQWLAEYPPPARWGLDD